MLQRRLFLLAALISFALISFGLLNADDLFVYYLPVTVGEPGPTATPASPPRPRGSINYEELTMGNLQSGAVDSWTIDVESSDYLTITVAPAASANMIISVLDPDGQIIVDRQNLAPAGEVETVANLSVNVPGLYNIHIAADPVMQSDYALMVMNSDSYPFAFRGTLNPGIPRSDSIADGTDVFWFFSATDGEIISLTVAPVGLEDAYVELYGPDSSRLLTLDDGLGGEAEILENQSILESGMYAIRVGEFDFEEMSYQIVMDK